MNHDRLPQGEILLDTLQRYVENGLMTKRTHPSLPLAIYNYTEMVQYRKQWDVFTVACRGLVLDKQTGAIVARPMTKFFNYSEHMHSTPAGFDFTVLEKLDGSLGIWFCYKGTWLMASRGSFESPQAKMGMKMATEKGLDRTSDGRYTYCFEIIAPENRIVVDYKARREIVLLAVSKTDTGHDFPSAELPSIATGLGVSCAKTFTSEELGDLDPEKMVDLDRANEEGFVIRYDMTGERVKVKLVKYLKLHRIGAGVRPKDVVEWLAKDPSDSVEKHLDKLPDELFDEAKAIEDRFRKAYDEARPRFDQVVDKYRSVEFRDVPKDLESSKSLFKALRLVKGGAFADFALESVRREYATDMAKRQVLKELSDGGHGIG